MSTGIVFTPLKGVLGLTAKDVIGTLTANGQLVVPDIRRVTQLARLPDDFVLKGSNQSIITLGALRKSLRQRFPKVTSYLSLGLECQFPTIELDEEYYSLPLPEETTLIRAAYNALADYRGSSRPEQLDVSLIVTHNQVPLERSYNFRGVHEDGFVVDGSVTLIGNHTCQPYYVSDIFTRILVKGTDHTYWRSVYYVDRYDGSVRLK